jgi:hypothetical protein
VAEPEPVHAGVDLQVIADRHGALAAAGLHGLGRRRARDARGEAELEDAVEVADAERTEDEIGTRTPARRSTTPSSMSAHGQHRGARLLERQRHALGAVAVRVGLTTAMTSGAVVPRPAAGRRGWR